MVKWGSVTTCEVKKQKETGKRNKIVEENEEYVLHKRNNNNLFI